MRLSTIRTVLWTVVAVVALSATGLYAYSAFNRPQAVAAVGAGDYQLTTTDGTPFTRASFEGHPSLLFFGFTHCPEVCPTTLAEMTAWYEALGDEAGDLKAYFITVDPERDTAPIVADYVSWTGHVTGVTGSVEEIEKAASAWAVYHQKVPLEGDDYTMDHTASVFLLNREGEFEGTIAYREEMSTAVGKIRKLLAQG
ncbi:protein SCO1/2 [Devosia crocina]|uniref:Protein SCO1/2 n=1 Tax=Devosia crocina TaxID=429728 RepID=A0A1I7N052_9HYPH|nr:SCO family protein [Devosia crocina]SFV28060.1 protein SCO1/2 [Devosia crocina]